MTPQEQGWIRREGDRESWRKGSLRVVHAPHAGSQSREWLFGKKLSGGPDTYEAFTVYGYASSREIAMAGAEAIP